MLKKVHIFISLAAAMVTLAVGLIKGLKLSEITLPLIIVIVVAYIVGSIVKGYLNKKVFIEKESDIPAEQEKPEDDESGDIEDEDM